MFTREKVTIFDFVPGGYSEEVSQRAEPHTPETFQPDRKSSWHDVARFNAKQNAAVKLIVFGIPPLRRRRANKGQPGALRLAALVPGVPLRQMEHRLQHTPPSRRLSPWSSRDKQIYGGLRRGAGEGEAPGADLRRLNPPIDKVSIAPYIQIYLN